MAIGEAILGAAGGIADAIFGNDNAKEQMRMQKVFAKNAIRWKVEDAASAGIHPLYALGANTATYQPVSVGTDLASIGSNIGRALDVDRTGLEKGKAFDNSVRALTLQKMGLENDLLASQLRTVNQAGHPPTRPGGGITATPASMTAGNGAININVNPANTPAQDFENQYGEIAGEIGGGANLITDIMRTGLTKLDKYGIQAERAVRQWLQETGNGAYNSKPWSDAYRRPQHQPIP